MAADAQVDGGGENRSAVVVVEWSTGRELVWASHGSEMVQWELGEDVAYRGRSWRVIARTESTDGLRLSIAPA